MTAASTYAASAPRRNMLTLSTRSLFLTALIFNMLIGFAFCYYFFDGNFIAGRTSSFVSPTGDFETYLTGAQFFIHDAWHFPLFKSHVVERSVPQSLAFFDLIPLYALIAKVIFKAGGPQIVYQSLWYATAIFMQPVAFTLLIWNMGVRNLLVLLIGGALAVLVPTFLFRAGHTALFGNFTFIVAMALYFAAVPMQKVWTAWPRWLRIVWPLWLCVVAAVNLYLLALALVFFGAALLQGLFDGSRSGIASRFGKTVFYGGLVVALLAAELYALGDFIPYRGGGEIGFNSMNILSSFVPQRSSLFVDGIPFLDATGGQSEGYNYLGAGILVLALAGLLLGGAGEFRLLRRHFVVTVCLLLLTLFAISNKAYLGHWLIWSFNAPESLGNFRNSGRFIWPVTYFVLALSLFSVAKLSMPKLALLLAVVAGLQWVDMGLLVGGMWNLGHAAVTTQTPRAEDERSLRKLIARYPAIHVEPDYGCLNTNIGQQYIQDLAWFTALENRRTNATYQARSPLDWHCDVKPQDARAAEDKGYLTFTIYNLNQTPAGLDQSNCALRPGALICMKSTKQTFTSQEVEKLFSPKITTP